MHLMRMPLLAAALATGIFTGDPCRSEGWCAYAIIAMLLLAAFARSRERRDPWPLLLALLVLAGGLLSPVAIRSSGNRSIADAEFAGTVTLRPCGAPGENRLILELDFACGDLGAGSQIHLELSPEHAAPEWGSRIAVRGDFFRYSSSLPGRPCGVIRCGELRIIAVTSQPLLAWSNRLRRGILDFARRRLRADRGGLLAAVLLGDFRLLEPRDAAALKRTGLIHLCSASGLHVAVVAGLCVWLARRLRLSRYAALALELPILGLYALAAGLTPPIVRASLLAVLACAGTVYSRDIKLLPALGAIGLICLLAEPVLLFEVSFQLSFGAVLAGCLLAPVLQRLFQPRGGAAKLLVATLAVQLGLAPLLLARFGEISLLSPLANLLVLPLVPALMVLGFAGAAVTPFSWLVAPAALASSWLLALILAIAHMLASPSWAAVFNPGMPPWQLLACYPLGWLCLARPVTRLSSAAGALGLAALCLIALWPGTALRAPPAGTEIIFLDVGQGDAILIRSPFATVLVDGGPDAALLQEKLRFWGVRRIDLVALTHGHADHARGLDGLSPAFPVASFVTPPQTDSDGRGLAEELSSFGTSVKTVSAGDLLLVGDLALRVMAPAGEGAGDNDDSLVLRLETERFSLLLTGDIGEEPQEELLSDGASLRADILKLPHHGAWVQTTERFIARVNPAVAVAQVGEDNSFGHPSRRTLECLRRLRARVFCTDERGDIVVRSRGGRLAIECARP
ncbi:MAG: DNA internalization-related competence protein ComEC/Rec2 [Candidatus Geothermincolia bacterium]